MKNLYIVTKHSFYQGRNKNGRWGDIPSDDYVVHSIYATRKEAKQVSEKLEKNARFYMYFFKRITLK